MRITFNEDDIKFIVADYVKENFGAQNIKYQSDVYFNPNCTNRIEVICEGDIVYGKKTM